MRKDVIKSSDGKLKLRQMDHDQNIFWIVNTGTIIWRPLCRETGYKTREDYWIICAGKSSDSDEDFYHPEAGDYEHWLGWLADKGLNKRHFDNPFHGARVLWQMVKEDRLLTRVKVVQNKFYTLLDG